MPVPAGPLGARAHRRARRSKQAPPGCPQGLPGLPQLPGNTLLSSRTSRAGLPGRAGASRQAPVHPAWPRIEPVLRPGQSSEKAVWPHYCQTLQRTQAVALAIQPLQRECGETQVIDRLASGKAQHAL